jgi:hypothetical protein
LALVWLLLLLGSGLILAAASGLPVSILLLPVFALLKLLLLPGSVHYVAFSVVMELQVWPGCDLFWSYCCCLALAFMELLQFPGSGIIVASAVAWLRP